MIDLWHPSPVKAGFQRVLKRMLGRVGYERLLFRWHVGHFPDLHVPRSFNEMLSWRKLYADLPMAPQLSDKLAVRDYVAKVADSRYLNPLLATANDAESLNVGALPQSFVVKATHASGMTILVPDRAQVDEASFKARLARFLATPYGRETNEWWYQQIEHRLVVEALRKDATLGLPPDFKFYVFRGQARFVHVDLSRLADHSCNFYDTAWRPLPFRIAYPGDKPGGQIPRPGRLDEMRELAETLAGGLDFVRVDLLCANDRDVIFGEMSLAPGSGWAPFEPAAADRETGDYWELES